MSEAVTMPSLKMMTSNSFQGIACEAHTHAHTPLTDEKRTLHGFHETHTHTQTDSPLTDEERTLHGLHETLTHTHTHTHRQIVH